MLLLLITALALEIIFFVVLPIISLIIIGYYVPVGLWLAALASGVYVSLPKLILMRIRQVKPQIIVYPLINATKAGIVLKRKELKKQLKLLENQKTTPFEAAEVLLYITS